jgi:probable F420-dependent oxidoreductase
MIFDAALPPLPLAEVPDVARSAEALGFDALWGSETIHDPFFPGAMVAEHTRTLKYGTSVAIAFARSPGNLAYTAWDLAQASDGRFILGLGTQVKPHIVRRFGMPWPESVVDKLREQIGAVRALWDCWQNGTRLNFRGDYYKLTLMSPFFNPGRIEHPDIPIYIAGVNTGLARLAGEVADGFVTHPFHSPEYLRDVIVPAIEEGAAKVGRSREDVQIFTTAFVVTSPEEELFVRAQIAFYASTPSYRRVMALHGWEEIAEQLSTLVRRDQWGEIATLIDGEMLATFAVVADEADLPGLLLERYQGLTDRLALYLPFKPGERDDFWKSMVKGIRSGA